MRKALRIIAICAFNIALVALFFGALEWVVRRVQIKRIGTDKPLPSSRMDRWTGWQNTPNYGRVDIRHNGQGFRRDSEVSREKPPNTVRIFFLGGSAAYGCEGLFPELDPEWKRIDNTELIDNYLEKLLASRHPERKWEVINAATNEFRLHQHLMLIHSKLAAYSPDAIILMDGHNDMSGMMTPQADYQAFEGTPHEAEFRELVSPKSLRSLLYINATWLRHNSMLFAGIMRRAQHRVFGEHEEDIFKGDPGNSKERVTLSDLSPPRQEQAKRALGRVGQYTTMAERVHHALRFEGIETIHTLQPELMFSRKPLTRVEVALLDHTRATNGRYVDYLYENMRPEISRRMTASAQANAYTFVDLQDALDTTAKKAFTDYCHLSSHGNELLAGRIYEAMRGKLIPQLVAKAGAGEQSREAATGASIASR